MKKRITSLILTACMLMLLSVSAFASTLATNDKDLASDKKYTIEFYDDFNSARINGEEYTSIRSVHLCINNYESEYTDYENILVIGESAGFVSEIYFLDSYCDDTCIFIDYELTNGELQQKYYLKNEYMDEYATLLTEYSDEVIVNFQYPEGNIVQSETKHLFENEPVEYHRDDGFDEFYLVYCPFSDSDSIGVYKGSIYSIDGSYYYYDNQYNSENHDDDNDDYIIYLSKITDEKLIEELSEAELLYQDNMGIFYDEELSQSVSKAILALWFLVIPFGLIILSIILLIKLPKKYRRILLTLLILSVITIIICLIMARMLF